MCSLPRAAEPLVSGFSVAFTRPTFQRVVVLILGAILSLRQRTVAAMLRSVGSLAKSAGHWSDFHRVLCRASWSCWPLGKVLAAMILELIPPDQALVVPVDDTAVQHRGKRVFGKGRHHDAIRSTHNHVAWLWGHKWVVLSINVKFPFAKRPWALPVLCALYRPEELNRSQNRRHKTPIRLAMQLMSVLMHWFPQRKFILVGDGGYASHELAQFCHRHRRHVTLISRLHADARLYDAPKPKPKGMRGRHRLRGKKKLTPRQSIEKSKRRRCTVSWYGGKTRSVELISDTGLWYRGGAGVVPIRWVFVHDLTGTHRDEYFYSTDQTLSPQQIVSLFTARWSIEVTFQETRTHLGLATPRNYSAKSVLRTTPCLLGLFSLVSLIFARQTRGKNLRLVDSPWYHKTEATFSDAITAVRRSCWQEILKQPRNHTSVNKLPYRLRLTLLDHLSRAA